MIAIFTKWTLINCISMFINCLTARPFWCSRCHGRPKFDSTISWSTNYQIFLNMMQYNTTYKSSMVFQLHHVFWTWHKNWEPNDDRGILRTRNKVWSLLEKIKSCDPICMFIYLLELFNLTIFELEYFNIFIWRISQERIRIINSYGIT